MVHGQESKDDRVAVQKRVEHTGKHSTVAGNLPAISTKETCQLSN